MNSQEFLIVNVTWISLLVLWYWRSRGAASKGPTELNLHAQDSAPLVIPPEERLEGRVEERTGERAVSGPVRNYSALNLSSQAMSAHAKNLNVIFNYNGHSWDAHEVLGVPAGAAMPAVTAAYQNALKKADPASYGFLETAYKSILHRF